MKDIYFIRLGSYGASLNLIELSRTEWMIRRIFVPVAFRNQGHGDDLLKQAIADADHEGVDLSLTISPFDGSNYKRLESWYQRHGFINKTTHYMRVHAKNSRVSCAST